MNAVASLLEIPWSPRRFETTRWSVVRRTTSADAVEAERACDLFCRVYWYPLYGFLRDKGYRHADAQDHVQSFLARLMHRGMLRRVDAARGRLRYYLTTLLSRHVAKRHRADRAVKRGGGVVHVVIDWSAAEEHYLMDYAALTEPEAAFRRGLAVTLVEVSVAELKEEYERKSRGALFEELLPSLEGVMVDETFAGLAEKLGMSPGAVRVAACRLREQFHKRLRLVAAAVLGMAVGPELDRELREIFG